MSYELIIHWPVITHALVAVAAFWLGHWASGQSKEFFRKWDEGN